MYFVSQEMPISVLPAISNVWTKHLVSKHFSFLLTPWSIIPLEVVGTNNSIPDKQMFLCTYRGERHSENRCVDIPYRAGDRCSALPSMPSRRYRPL